MHRYAALLCIAMGGGRDGCQKHLIPRFGFLFGTWLFG